MAPQKTPGAFRPINLCNTIYKVATKVMAFRLTKVLLDLVSIQQSTFVKNRSIYDNTFAAWSLFIIFDKAKHQQQK